jgi:predicted metal-binding membrane protein
LLRAHVLLFVAGVMNLLWVGIIAVAVLLEKVLPRDDLAGRVAGLALVAIGLNMAAAALVI